MHSFEPGLNFYIRYSEEHILVELDSLGHVDYSLAELSGSAHVHPTPVITWHNIAICVADGDGRKS